MFENVLTVSACGGINLAKFKLLLTHDRGIKVFVIHTTVNICAVIPSIDRIFYGINAIFGKLMVLYVNGIALYASNSVFSNQVDKELNRQYLEHLDNAPFRLVSIITF